MIKSQFSDRDIRYEIADEKRRRQTVRLFFLFLLFWLYIRQIFRLYKLRHWQRSLCTKSSPEVRITTGFLGWLWRNVHFGRPEAGIFSPSWTRKKPWWSRLGNTPASNASGLCLGKKKGIRGGDAAGYFVPSAVGIADAPFYAHASQRVCTTHEHMLKLSDKKIRKKYGWRSKKRKERYLWIQ